MAPGAQSASLLISVEKTVRALELFEPRFKGQPVLHLQRSFYFALSSERFMDGRVLLGTGRPDQARKQFWFALKHSRDSLSW
jgi:hypothetical protein